MAFLGDLLVRLGVNTADFSAGLSKAEHVAVSSSRKIGRAIGSVQGVLAGLGIAASATGLALYAKDVIKSTAALDDMAEQTGATVESLSKIQTAAKIGGHEFAGVTDALGKMVKGLKSGDETGKDALHALRTLGVEAKDANGRFRDTGVILEDVAKSLAKYEDGGNKIALLQDLLGRSGARYASLLKDMAEDGERVAKVTAEQAAKAEELEKNVNRIGIAFEDVGRKLSLEFLPGLTKLTEEFLALHNAGFSLLGTLTALARMKLGSLLPGAPADTLGQIADIDKELAKRREGNEIMARSRGYDEAIKRNYADINRLLAIRSALVSTFAKNARGMAEDAAGNVVPASSLSGKSRLDYQSLKKDNSEALARKAAAETLKYENALSGLQKQLFSYSVTELMAHEITKGSLASLSEERKKSLLLAAQEVDAKNQRLAIENATNKMLESEARANDDRNKVLSEQLISNHQMLQDQEFELVLLGKTAREAEIMNAQRRIELDLRKQIAALPKLEEGATPQQIAAHQNAVEMLRERAKEQTRLVTEGIQQRQEAERDWSTGVERAFKDYAEAASDGATIANNMVTSAFQGMEDALVKFVQGGKINFKDFANSLIADIIRIQARMALAEAAKGGGGLLGSLAKGIGSVLGFGGGLGYGSAGTAAGTAMVSNGAGGFVAALADGGDFMAGRPIMVGEEGPELMLPRMAGTVIPNDALGGGTMSVTIYQTNNIDSRSDMASVIAAMRSAKDEAVAEIYDRFSRGERA